MQEYQFKVFKLDSVVSQKWCCCCCCYFWCCALFFSSTISVTKHLPQPPRPHSIQLAQYCRWWVCFSIRMVFYLSCILGQHISKNIDMYRELWIMDPAFQTAAMVLYVDLFWYKIHMKYTKIKDKLFLLGNCAKQGEKFNLTIQPKIH